MKKIIGFLLIICAALGLYVLFVMNGREESEKVAEPSAQTKEASEVDVSIPSIFYVTHTPNEIDVIYSYALNTGEAMWWSGPIGGALPPKRMNQVNSLCDKNENEVSVGSLLLQCENAEAGYTIRLFESETEKTVLTRQLRLEDVGLEPSATNGYLVPVGAFADGSALLLGRRVETESYVSGLWRMDIPSGQISEISAVRDNDIFHYDINPKTKELIGTSFTPPENLGAPPTGPSAVYLINLLTGDTRILQSSETIVFENAMLDDDGLRYTFRNYNEMSYDIHPVFVDKNSWSEGGQGIIRDWFDDTLVVDRDGNLVLIDLATHTEKVLTQESDASVEYLGVTR